MTQMNLHQMTMIYITWPQMHDTDILTSHDYSIQANKTHGTDVVTSHKHKTHDTDVLTSKKHKTHDVFT